MKPGDVEDAHLVRRRPSCEGRGLKLHRAACPDGTQRSPLMRGAWIETVVTLSSSITRPRRPSCEGRGLKRFDELVYGIPERRRPSCEGRGLKLDYAAELVNPRWSPLMRGAWIETTSPFCPALPPASPLMRGAWIETSPARRWCCNPASPLMRGAWIETCCSRASSAWSRSPLMRGAWIETHNADGTKTAQLVAPHARGVD